MENNQTHDLFAHINVIHRLLAHLYQREYTRASLPAVREQLMMSLEEYPQPLPGFAAPSEVLLDVQRRAAHIMDSFLRDIAKPPEDSRA